MADLTLNEDQTHGVVEEDVGVGAPPIGEQDAKTELDGGYHKTSATFGTVVSDYATDAAGHTPADIAAFGGAADDSSDDSDDVDDDKPGKGPKPQSTIGTEPIAERDMTGEPKPRSTPRPKK
jgi:hypothetical protein